MGIGPVFWILMIIWIVFGLAGVSFREQLGTRVWYGHGFFLFVLFFLLGWEVFGFIIQGPGTHR